MEIKADRPPSFEAYLQLNAPEEIYEFMTEVMYGMLDRVKVPVERAYLAYRLTTRYGMSKSEIGPVDLKWVRDQVVAESKEEMANLIKGDRAYKLRVVA